MSEKEFLRQKERENNILREELEEQRIKEENEIATSETEVAKFYFVLQIATVREVFFKNEAHELSGGV